MSKHYKTEVFGTKYDVHILDQPDEVMYLNGYDGYVNFDEKYIYIMNKRGMSRVYLHELIHAHLYECGQKQLANNENAVEALTEVFERITKTLKEEENNEPSRMGGKRSKNCSRKRSR